MNTNTENTSPETRGYSDEHLAVMREILTIAASTPKHVADVFVSYAPHVDGISVQAYACGWSNRHPDFRAGADCDSLIAVPVVLREKLKSYLAGLRAKPTHELRSETAAAMRNEAARLLAEASELEGAK
jgi:hypothetical protein